MRGWIYDQAVLRLTIRWYDEVLARLPDRARLLDIGIGTGGALAANAHTLNSKDLSVVGVDIDEDYVKRCRKIIEQNHLSGRVQVRLKSIYDFNETGFDAAYFSSSFMIMPDPFQALRQVMGLLNDGGQVYFTQYFEEKQSKVVERVKPLLKKVTTIEFGRATYEPDFMKTLDDAGLEIVEYKQLSRGKNRNGRLVVGVPRELVQ
ncbi:MAG: class I SAM-dependent methyltransferase [Proteobacteria bacterium]|mgnify:CR=1 FL=1|jgi:ubiquinone/menaquinone biosynthesis C-methylase UbiE|nr:class I SAM-dependent methyltransferase [Pseudomonadota bacterium]